MSKVLKAMGDVLYLAVSVAGLTSSAWQHSVWIVFWLLMLAVVLLTLFRQYSNITFKTVNNIYNVKSEKQGE